MMVRPRVDDWSIRRSLAFVAATFAIVMGALLPFAVLAATPYGQPLVICSAQGPQTIQAGGLDGPSGKAVGAKCAACVMPLQAALPAPPADEPAAPLRVYAAVVYAPAFAAPPPPARAPPRPPSTAPPLA